MIVQNKQIVNYLLKKFPLKLQEEWDETGFKNFNGNKTACVVLTMDPDLNAVHLAMRQHAHLIISHHPIFLKSKEIEPSPIDKKVVKLLKQNKIDLLSLHTNVDNSPIGINRHVLEQFGCKNIKVVSTKEGKFFCGDLPKAAKTSVLVKQFKKIFKTTKVISLAKNNNRIVKKVYLACGAGFFVIKNNITKFKNTDLVLTGDIKWHDWTLIDQLNVNVVDIAHDIEKHFVNMLEPFIKKQFNVRIIKSHPSIIFNII